MKKLIILAICIHTYYIWGQVPTAGLTGAWPFNGNANDISGSANHGTVVGATLIADRCGNSNSAYSFNGTNNYIKMLTTGPTGTVSRSISFWARTTNTVINSPRASLCYGLNSGNGDSFEIVWNYCGQGVGLDVSNQAYIRGNVCLLNNQWHHIAVVYDATVSTIYSTVKYYFDGVLQPGIICNVSGTTAAINTGNTFPITIGTNMALNRFFSGALDDFYIYNRALTQAEILQLYNIMPCTPPIFGNTVICIGSSNIYSVNPISNVNYTWTLPGGWTGSSTSSSIQVTTGTSAGTIMVSYSGGTCGVSGTSTLAVSITTTAPLSATASNSVICSGQTVTLTATGATASAWQPQGGSGTMVTVAPTANTIYTVTGTNTLGCSSSGTVAVNIKAPGITTKSQVICKGSTATLTANGGLIYTWQPGNTVGPSIVVTPTNNTSYTVTSTVAGCSNVSSAVISLTLASCTGMDEAAREPSGNTLFPNPNKGRFSVHLSQKATITLVNLLGEIINNLKMEAGTHQFDIGEEAGQIFFMKIECADGTKIITIIKE